MLDPDPRNNGRAIALLGAGGVEVVVGLLADEARRDLLPYLALTANGAMPSARD